MTSTTVGHWRTFVESDVIRYVDLQDKEYTLEIAKVEKGKVIGSGGKASGKPLIFFKGREKPMAGNTSICTAIAGLYGNDTRAWVGKLVTIYPDHSVKFGGAQVGGIRVRPVVPKETAK